MRSTDNIVMKNPRDLIEWFSQLFHGEINASSISLLQSIHAANPSGLIDIIIKLNHIKVQASANLLNLTTQTLLNQRNLPLNTMGCIEEFMQIASKQKLLSDLRGHGPHPSKVLQSLEYLMDTLGIFVEASLSQRFLRTIILIMAEWDSHPERCVQDAAKWLQRLFGFSHQSPLTQVVQIIADLLQLNNAVIPGKLRNMDCLELFFQLKQLSETAEIKILPESSKPWMQQLYAALLVIKIYQNSEHAFYDIVIWQEQQPEFSLINGLTTYLSKSMVLAEFFDSSAFQPYFFQPRHQGNRVNQHIFLKSLSRYVGALSEETNLRSFAQACSAKLKDCDPLSFAPWYQHHPFFQTIDSSMLTLWFEAFQSMAAEQIAQHAGRIRASSLQLVNLGYSPRAKKSHRSGGFNPMVNTEIAAINSVNLHAMRIFFEQKNHDQRLKLLQEFFLGYVIDQRSKQPLKEPFSHIDRLQSHAFTLFKPSRLRSSLPKTMRHCPAKLSHNQANPHNATTNIFLTGLKLEADNHLPNLIITHHV